MEVEKLQRDAVILKEAGILNRKGGGFHSPTHFAQENLFCVIWGNEYTCAAPYEVRRTGLNMFVLFRILEGNLFFDYEGKTFTASDGDVVMIDGIRLHHYYAKDPVRFQHFTFLGNSSRAYYEFLFHSYGALYSDKTETAFLFNYIQNELEQILPDDHKLSFLVHNILSVLAIRSQSTLSPPVQKAQSYIHNNFAKNLHVEDLAEQVSLSRYYFSRLFKAETGYSPYEYLSLVRLKRARELLSETDLSVEAIASECGYSSASHFIRAFKKEIGITPLYFKKFFDPTGFRYL